MRTKARGAGSANSGVADCDQRLDAEKPAALSYFKMDHQDRRELIVHPSHPPNCEVCAQRREQCECAGKQHAACDLQSAQIVIEIMSLSRLHSSADPNSAAIFN
jgi:hypothetical protein